jgi:acyl carrier protein
MTPNAAEIKAFVMERLAPLPQASHTRLDDNTPLVGSGMLDSLGFLELISSVEQEFDLNCDFSEVEPEVFTTLGGFVAQFVA